MTRLLQPAGRAGGPMQRKVRIEAFRMQHGVINDISE